MKTNLFKSFPTLNHFFGAYLNEDASQSLDFHIEEYMNDSDSDTIKQVIYELDNLINQNYSEEKIEEVLNFLGCNFLLSNNKWNLGTNNYGDWLKALKDYLEHKTIN